MKVVTQKQLSHGISVLITVENEDLLESVNRATDEAFRKGIAACGTLMYSTWADTARRVLKSSRSYVQNLEENNEPEYGGNPYEYNITQNQRARDGKQSLAIILEDGIEAFDMKEKILKGRKSVKVRFEYGSPTQTHTRKLSDEIHKVAKKYDKFTNDSYGLQHSQVEKMFGSEAADKINPAKTKNFSALSGNYHKTGGTGFLAQGGTPSFGFKSSGGLPVIGGKRFQTINYKWKTREFERMKGETTKSGDKVEVHTYAVYRTISKKSASDSWIHPGIRPMKIFETAASTAIPKFGEIIITTLKDALPFKS